MKNIYSLLTCLLLTGTAQTFAQGDFSSNVATGDWNVAGSWTLTSGTDADGIPDADDNVSILDGHTITITDDAACASLTVGAGTSGTLNIGNSAGDDLAVSGNITINTGASILAQSTGVLTAGGNLTNNGTLDFNNGANDVNILFNGTANQTLSGTGSITDVNLITINNSGADGSNIVEVISTAFTAAQGFLTLTDGIFKVSRALSNSYFTPANYTIPAGAGIWLNHSLATIIAQGGNATLAGSVRVTAGNYRIGILADNSLQYSGSTAQLTIEGGAVTIGGRFCRDGNAASTITYNQSGGNFLVGTIGSTSTTRSLFEIANAGSSFTMSGGAIILASANASFSSDYFNEAGTYSVTSANGLQIGHSTTPAGQIMRINSTVPVGALVLSTTNTPTAELVTGLTVNNSVSIGAGNTLNANNLNISVGRSWANSGTFNAGTGTVTFNGSLGRSFSGTSPTSFYNLVFNTTTAILITFNTAQTVTNSLTLTDGIVATSATGLLTLTDNATVTGASDASFISGPVRKIGDDAFTFPTGKTAGGLYQPISISAPANPTDDFTAEYIRGSAATVDPDMVAPVLNVSNCDYWTLTKNSAAAASIDVTLSWNANSPCSAFPYVTNPATLTVAHHNGAAWDEAGTSGSFTGTAAAGTVTRNAVSVFSPFSLGNTALNENPLPVKFGRLKGYEKNNGVQLSWETYTEENVSHYEVQRSATGNQFSNIARIAARNVPGRSEYALFDATPFPATNFYQVKSVDIDGRVSYSRVIRMELGKKGSDITVYPNPVRGGQLSFHSADLPKGDYVIKVYDNHGKQLHSESLKHSGGAVAQTLALPVAIKAGVYFLQIDNGNKGMKNKVFVVL